MPSKMPSATLRFLLAIPLTLAALYGSDIESLRAAHEARLKAIETGNADLLVSLRVWPDMAGFGRFWPDFP